MTRTLTELSSDQREMIITTVHKEAEAAGWSQLSNSRKSALYSAWESQYNLSHATLKDGIMKGFDAAQGIPKKAEAEIQDEVTRILRLAGINVIEQAQMWTGKERADLLIGYSAKFPTHVIEIERADSWSEGLRQALWYQAAIFKAERRHVLPVLILFGNTSSDRFEQILATCDHNHMTLCTHRLDLDGTLEAEYSLGALLNGAAFG
ncbi:MAG TPA: hypothetical protein DHV68_01960 [Dehalococcoidia bacterium]|nr:hypothetical protein [Chloroflexota bacterium]HCI85590.1 hypothetical protein [Dehalococcoidia bacterium]|tara:strand:+ start:915 stop:1535 length:621 start_codon:yes stop_codon:yes gene_type:complete